MTEKHEGLDAIDKLCFIFFSCLGALLIIGIAARMAITLWRS